MTLTPHAHTTPQVREAAINATLDHPHVVATYSYDMVPLASALTMSSSTSGGPGGSGGAKGASGIHDWELFIIMEYWWVQRHWGRGFHEGCGGDRTEGGCCKGMVEAGMELFIIMEYW